MSHQYEIEATVPVQIGNGWYLPCAAEDVIAAGIRSLGQLARNGQGMNGRIDDHAAVKFFEGYRRACDDILRSVIDPAFKGKPVVVRRQASSPAPEYSQAIFGPEPVRP